MMQRSRRWGLLLAGIVVAAAVAGAAGAANSGGYVDKTGDGALAPDIRSVNVSNDDSGMIRVEVMAGRIIALSNEEFVVGIDADQNPDTGTIFYGADYALDLAGTTAQILRAGADGFFEPASGGVSVQETGDVITFTVKASDVGLSTTAGFNVFVASVAAGSGDVAPDVRTFNYQQVAGTAPPALGRDTRAPYEQAYKAAGKRGKQVLLYYRAADGRGMTADAIRVYSGTKVLKTVRYKLEDSVPMTRYYVKWTIPKRVKGKLRYCVQSVDAAGNKSNTACARLTVT